MDEQEKQMKIDAIVRIVLLSIFSIIPDNTAGVRLEITVNNKVRTFLKYPKSIVS